MGKTYSRNLTILLILVLLLSCTTVGFANNSNIDNVVGTETQNEEIIKKSIEEITQEEDVEIKQEEVQNEEGGKNKEENEKTEYNDLNKQTGQENESHPGANTSELIEKHITESIDLNANLEISNELNPEAVGAKDNTWDAKDFVFGEIRGEVAVLGFTSSGISKYQRGGTMRIPSSDEKGRITRIIGPKAFQGRKLLRKVIIPSTIQEIDDEAFRGTGLKEIEAPGVIKLGGDLDQTSGSEVKKVGVFMETPLEKISLPSLVEMGSQNFQDCVNLQEVDFPRLEKMGSANFVRDRSLREIRLPTLKEMNAGNFRGCEGLEKAEFPELRWFGGDNNFAIMDENSKLDQTLLPKLKYIMINEHIKVDIYTFRYHIAVNEGGGRKLEIRTNTGNIPEAFKDSPEGGNYKFVENLIKDQDIGEGWIVSDFTYDTYKGKNIVTGLSETGRQKVKIKPIMVISNINLDGEEVVGIKDYIFSGNKDIKEVKIPNSITEVVLVGVESNKGLFSGSTITSINAPGLKTLRSQTFSQCNNLTKINLPKLKSMVDNNFAFCRNVTNINLPELIEMQSSNFYGCERLTSINIPKFIRFTSDMAANNFSNEGGRLLLNLKKVIVSEDIEEMGDRHVAKHITREDKLVIQTNTGKNPVSNNKLKLEGNTYVFNPITIRLKNTNDMGLEITGSEFKLINKADNTITTTLNITTGGTITRPIPQGTYLIEQVITPNGYRPSPEQEITVKYNKSSHQPIEIKIVNIKDPVILPETGTNTIYPALCITCALITIALISKYNIKKGR